jgi:hypothetical protein
MTSLTQPASALVPSAERKRALVDAGTTLVIVMLMWPFPLARATLAPVVNISLIVVAWWLLGIAYCAIAVRFWHKTGGMYLLRFELAPVASAAGSGSDLRWGVAAGALLIVTCIWPGAARLVSSFSGFELRELPR